jgi:hypothetical protein
MQDRYAGDIGDYQKLGPRWLCANANREQSLRLGVVWSRGPRAVREVLELRWNATFSASWPSRP